MTRLDALAASLDVPLLVTNAANLTYLTGFRSSNAALLVEPSGEVRLYTDFRYAEAAQEVVGAERVETRRDLFGALAELLAGRSIGFEAVHTSYASAERLRAGGVELQPTAGLVEALRAVKDESELDAIRRAAELSDRVYGELAQERFTGRTERELAWLVERRLRELGAEAVAFAPIVAAGEHGARPHAAPRDVAIPADTLVTIDMGCKVDGYCSDCTRTFATGSLGDELARAYDLCLRAQLDGLAAVRAAIPTRDVDAASRVQVEAAGLGWAYGHGLGHGVGMDVHEAPTMRPESEGTLAPGNVVTVEPGIYLPGVGGVRIEDLVVVTVDGCEILTHFGKELVTVS
jgi:Xaa-Pro aminopeptidase